MFKEDINDTPLHLLNDSSFLFCKNDTRIYAKLGFANLTLNGNRRFAPILSMKYVHVLHHFVAASLHFAVQIHSRRICRLRLGLTDLLLIPILYRSYTSPRLAILTSVSWSNGAKTCIDSFSPCTR